MDKSIGLVTLGQSTRSDILESLDLPSEIRVEFIGALDDVSKEEVNQIIWNNIDYNLPLYSKFEGENIILAKNKLVPYLQKAITKIESKVSITTIICTESFPSIRHKKPHIKIDQILINLSKSISCDSQHNSFGIFIPDPNKIVASETRWDLVGESRTVFLRPYATDDEIRNACKLLRKKLKSPQYLILDCMGFGEREVQILREEFDGIVICPLFFLRNQIMSLFTG